MAVGSAVLNEIIEKNLVINAQQQGIYIQEKLSAIATQFNLTNIRGKGLLIAFDLPKDIGSEVVSSCLANGLIINSPQPATIRLMPPLIVTNKDIEDMIEILSSTLAKIFA